MVMVRVNPYPNQTHNQPEERNSNQSEARISDLSNENGRHVSALCSVCLAIVDSVMVELI